MHRTRSTDARHGLSNPCLPLHLKHLDNSPRTLAGLTNPAVNADLAVRFEQLFGFTEARRGLSNPRLLLYLKRLANPPCALAGLTSPAENADLAVRFEQLFAAGFGNPAGAGGEQ